MAALMDPGKTGASRTIKLCNVEHGCRDGATQGILGPTFTMKSLTLNLAAWSFSDNRWLGIPQAVPPFHLYGSRPTVTGVSRPDHNDLLKAAAHRCTGVLSTTDPRRRDPHPPALTPPASSGLPWMAPPQTPTGVPNVSDLTRS
jgi:hypothetical protein